MSARRRVRRGLWTWGGCAVLAAIAAAAVRAPRPWVEIARPQPLGDVFVQARRSPFRPWTHTDRDWADRLRRVAPATETARTAERETTAVANHGDAERMQEASPAEASQALLEPAPPVGSGWGIAETTSGGDEARTARVDVRPQAEAERRQDDDLPPTPPTDEPSDRFFLEPASATTTTNLRTPSQDGSAAGGSPLAVAQQPRLAPAREAALKSSSVEATSPLDPIRKEAAGVDGASLWQPSQVPQPAAGSVVAREGIASQLQAAPTVAEGTREGPKAGSGFAAPKAVGPVGLELGTAGRAEAAPPPAPELPPLRFEPAPAASVSPTSYPAAETRLDSPLFPVPPALAGDVSPASVPNLTEPAVAQRTVTETAAPRFMPAPPPGPVAVQAAASAPSAVVPKSSKPAAVEPGIASRFVAAPPTGRPTAVSAPQAIPASAPLAEPAANPVVIAPRTATAALSAEPPVRAANAVAGSSPSASSRRKDSAGSEPLSYAPNVPLGPTPKASVAAGSVAQPHVPSPAPSTGPAPVAPSAPASVRIAPTPLEPKSTASAPAPKSAAPLEPSPSASSRTSASATPLESAFAPRGSSAPLEPSYSASSRPAPSATPLEPGEGPAPRFAVQAETPLEPGLTSPAGIAAPSEQAERGHEPGRRGSWDERTERLRIDLADGAESIRRRPPALAARLERLAGRSECASWAGDTLAALERLVKAPADADPGVEAELTALRGQWSAVDRLLQQSVGYETEVEWRQTRYALQRWLDVRGAAFGLARVGKTAFSPPKAFQLAAHRGAVAGVVAVEPVWNLPLVIGHVERFEWQRDAESAEFLALASDAFLRSPDAGWRALGDQLRLHYRNHNVRVALHKDFVNRFVPQQQAEPGRVCEEIAGVPVRGRSVTQTRVSLDFLPARDQLTFALLVDGSVDSWTQAEASGAEFSNFGRARFLARVPLTVTPAGPSFGEPQVDVQAEQYLRGFTTMADDLPLMNTLVRSFAKSRYDAEQEATLAETRGRIGARVRRRIQETLAEQRGGKADGLRNQILGTLESLSLRPTEADMQTTSDRLTLRTRLAAPTHLAAWTPRPEAPAGSVASLQAHESLVNNFLSQLGLSGRRIQIKALPSELAKRFNLQLKVNGDEIPADLYWSFAERDGIRVELLDEKLDVHLKFDEVEHKEHVAGEMTVSVSYRPMLTEEGVQFVRDGGVRVRADGESFKTKWYFRALFTKVFPKGKELTVVPAKLLADPRLAGWGVTQIALRDGWFGVAIGPRVSGPAAPGGASPTRTVLLPTAHRP